MSQKSEAKQLRDHLFRQMEKLSDPTADLEKEVKRADALAKMGTVIVNSHKQEVDMMKLYGGRRKSTTGDEPKQLEDGK